LRELNDQLSTEQIRAPANPRLENSQRQDSSQGLFYNVKDAFMMHYINKNRLCHVTMLTRMLDFVIC